MGRTLAPQLEAVRRRGGTCDPGKREALTKRVLWTNHSVAPFAEVLRGGSGTW